MRTKKQWSIGLVFCACCAVVMSSRAAELKVDSSRTSPRISSTPAEPAAPRKEFNGVLKSSPLRPNTPVTQLRAGDTGAGSIAAVAEKLVYSNTLGTDILQLHPSGIVADDLTLLVTNGCPLMRFKFRVIGQAVQGSLGGPYQIEYALHHNCPGAGGPDAAQIPGTAGTVNIVDDSVVTEITHTVMGGPVPLHSTVWLALKTNRANVGVIAGAPSLVGFSNDRLDFPGFACNADAGGFPEQPQASFYVELYADAACAASFPGYSNLHPGRGGFQEGASWCMADDVKLNVSQCNMIGYDVGVRLASNTPAGTFRFQIHSNSSNLPGAAVAGTDRSFPVATGGGAYVGRFTFSPPIPLPGDIVWFAVHGNNPGSSWILTRTDAEIGQTNNVYARARANLAIKSCNAMFTNPQFEAVFLNDATAHAGFDVTIHCAGEAPKGACCDMYLTNDGVCNTGTDMCEGGEFNNQPCFADIDCKGDPKCRFIPQMNCSFPPRNTGFRPAWVPGQPCKKCQGGSMNNQSCETNANCPGGGTCVVNNTPFGASTPCGVAACCPPDESSCDERTEKECARLEPAYEPNTRQWQLGRFCGDDGQRCPRVACLGREGECTEARDKHCEGGVENGTVCELDSECRGFCGSAICFGGPNSGQPCSNNSDCEDFLCRSICEGGPFPNMPCQLDDHCNRDATCVFIDNGTRHCVGGDNDGTVCTNNLQCPGGACSAKFCQDLVPPEDSPRHGKPCTEPRQCREAVCEGDPGCESPFCCTAVCMLEADRFDSTFCCDFHWDNVCAQMANQIAAGLPGYNAMDCSIGPDNEHCAPEDRSGGAQDIEINSSTPVPLTTAMHSSEEPNFCCHTGLPNHCNLGNRMDEFCETNEDCWDATCERRCVGGANVGLQCDGSFSCFGGPNFGDPCKAPEDCPGGTCNDSCYDGLEGGVCDVAMCFGGGTPVEGRSCPNGRAECNTDRICELQTAEARAAHGTVWYRFDIPPGPNPVSVRVNTCNSTNAGAFDSMLQVFTTLDSDAGRCANFGRCDNGDPCDTGLDNCTDGSDCVGDDDQPCSIADQDCGGGTTCVVDLNTQCSNLLLLGCNDDAPDGCAAEGHPDRANNAKLCMGNLEPGRTYYVEVGVKNPESEGTYLLQLSVVANCGAEGAENDSCISALEITEDGSFAFDLNAATFECPPPSCAPASRNDVWFKYIPKANGTAEFNTCGGSPQPDTEMAIYEGCDCPTVDNPPPPLACSGFAGGACGDGSRIQNIQVIGGQCYLIRIGDRNGLGGSGMISINNEEIDCQGNGIEDRCDIDCDRPGCNVPDCGQSEDCDDDGQPDECQFEPECCPSGAVTFTNPVSGVIDARTPFNAFGPNVLLGIQQVTVSAPPGAAILNCWELCETASVAGSPNGIDSVVANGNGTYTIMFDRPITPSACTTLTFKAGDGARPTASYIYHPGNVNGIGNANAQDIDALVAYLNTGLALPNPNVPYGLISSDIDRSGNPRAPDIEALIDVLNGGGPLLNPANNTAIPSCATCLQP